MVSVTDVCYRQIYNYVFVTKITMHCDLIVVCAQKWIEDEPLRIR